MNYLAHLYLAQDSPESLVGSLLGDFVKGDDYRRYSPPIQEAILTHRHVDAFTDVHPVYRRSKGRLDPAFRHTKRILVDMYYDHFLAKNWPDYSAVPLEEFTRTAYRALDQHAPDLPPRLQRMLPYMKGEDWLLSYRELEGIGRALWGLSRRLAYPNHLDRGLDDLKANYAALENDFREFLPLLEDYVTGLKSL
ncbi:MAG: ACP phosphodiesterase [Candidatus Neomarinimicrobiota bacterium]